MAGVISSVSTLPPLFHVGSAGGSSREKNIVAKVKQGLLRPEWTIVSRPPRGGDEEAEAEKRSQDAGTVSVHAERALYEEYSPQYNAQVDKIDKRAILCRTRSCCWRRISGSAVVLESEAKRLVVRGGR